MVCSAGDTASKLPVSKDVPSVALHDTDVCHYLGRGGMPDSASQMRSGQTVVLLMQHLRSQVSPVENPASCKEALHWQPALLGSMR